MTQLSHGSSPVLAMTYSRTSARTGVAPLASHVAGATSFSDEVLCEHLEPYRTSSLSPQASRHSGRSRTTSPGMLPMPSSACRNWTLVAENTPLRVPEARSVTANGPAADSRRASSPRSTLPWWKKKSRSRLIRCPRRTAMAVPPPRYASDGTSGAMASHVAAVSGGRISRTRSEGIGSIPGEVVRERPLGRLKAAGGSGVLPGARGQVRSSPGETVGVEGRDQPPGDERCRVRDVELGRGHVPEQVQQVRGNAPGVRPFSAGWQSHPGDHRREREPPRRPEADLVHRRLHGLAPGEHHRRLRDEALGRELSEGTSGGGRRDPCPPCGLAHGRHAPR